MDNQSNFFSNSTGYYTERYKSSSKVLIIGAGISGKACARWLAKEGKIVTIVDSRELDSKKDIDIDLVINSGIKFPLSSEWFDQIDLVVVSPGLSPHIGKKSGLAPILEFSNKKNIPVFTELDLFEVANNIYFPKSDNKFSFSKTIPIMAITGTNGKTSVVKLITKILKSIGIDAQHAGNVEPSLLEAFLERKIKKKIPDIWVLELSSFQLALSNHFSPSFSTILNFSDDHFDWHLNSEEYLLSKLKIFGIPKPTAKPFICRDAPKLSERINQYFKNQKKSFSSITFGLGKPEKNYSFGISKSENFCFKSNEIKNNFYEFPIGPKDINLAGTHNYSNITCCLAMVCEVSDKFSLMSQVLKEHTGESHRLESFLTVKNINYIDDSKATNVGATISAIESFSEPIILILGGLTKGQNFCPLNNILKKRSIDLIVFGNNVELICQSFRNSGLIFEKVSNLRDAVSLANKIAKNKISISQKNTTKINILLSPACSSLDMFENYRHRGEEFKKLVSNDYHGENLVS